MTEIKKAPAEKAEIRNGGEIRKACVIGYPISHSLSPVIHNYWLRKYDISGEYSAVEVRPEDLESFIRSMPQAGFSGCNITIPHKETAWKIVSQFHRPETQDSNTLPVHVADFMQAINTIVIDENKNYIATNTDFIGFARNLIESAPEHDYKNSIAYIIGAGGASKAVAFALASMNVKQIVLTNRTREKCSDIKDMLVRNFSFPSDRVDIIEWERRNEVIQHCNLIVNTTSLGMLNQPPLDIEFKNLPEGSLVTDIVYNPLETDFLKKAKAAGAKTVDGLGMLLHQAAPGFEAWFGVKPQVNAELRDQVLNHLKKRQ